MKLKMYIVIGKGKKYLKNIMIKTIKNIDLY